MCESFFKQSTVLTLTLNYIPVPCLVWLSTNNETETEKLLLKLCAAEYTSTQISITNYAVIHFTDTSVQFT